MAGGFAFSALGFVICVAFQNCAGYSAASNPLYDNASTAVCIGLECGPDPTQLQLAIDNDSSVAVKNGTATGTCGTDDSSCVDIGGYCDAGGYPDNQISYYIYGGTVNQNATVLSGVKCVDGRFQAQIVLPSGYDYANIHQLRLTIYGIDATGNIIDSTNGGNYREVSIASYN